MPLLVDYLQIDSDLSVFFQLRWGKFNNKKIMEIPVWNCFDV